MIIVHDAACEGYSQPGHPERPVRISATVALLQSQKELPIEWLKPGEVKQKSLLRAHTELHLQNIKNATAFDQDTPAFPGIEAHARRSVGAALTAMEAALSGKHAFSLMRPPGHHAEREKAMGFCYLNQAAICALEALSAAVMRVAVFDFDVHHGNGTEDILQFERDAMFCSVHQFPCYPGTGRESREHCLNFPIPPNSPASDYMSACKMGLERIHAWHPDLLIVSAGFDAYARDPLAQQSLELEHFQTLGQWIKQTGIPSFSLLEGGYSGDLPQCLFAYLKGLEMMKI